MRSFISNNPLVSEEEYQRINANYLSILKSERFAKYYLSCFCLHLDDDDNLRIEVKKTHKELFNSYREFMSYFHNKLFPVVPSVL